MVDLTLYRKMANTYLVENSEQNAINQFVYQSDKIWDSTLSTYDLLAPSKRGDDIIITDRNKIETSSRGVFNYNKEHTSATMLIGQERCFFEKDSVEAGYYIKRVRTNEDYLIETLTENKFLFEDTFIRKCNGFINFVDKFGAQQSYSCVRKLSSDTAIDTTENKYMETVSGDLIVKVQYNDNTNILSKRTGQRFIFSEQECYKLKNLYLELFEGVIVLKMEQDEINFETDKLIDIGGGNLRWFANYTESPIYEISIDQDDSEVITGNTLQLSAQINKDGQSVDEEITWGSSDELVATVDSDGLVTTIADGVTSITATMTNNIDVLDNISITVAGSVAQNISYSVTPDIDGIILTDTIVFEAQAYDNGSPITETFTLSIDPSTTAIASDYDFIIIDANTFSIKNNNNGKSVSINVVPDSNPDDVFVKTYSLNYFY